LQLSIKLREVLHPPTRVLRIFVHWANRPHVLEYFMNDASMDRFFDLLDVRLDAFAMCEIENGYSLTCTPADKVIVHYVLRGEGTVTWDGGALALQPGMIVVVPRLLAKQIAGAGPVLRTVPADDACPLAQGIVRYRACRTGAADLVLACASVDAKVGEKLGFFDGLRAPLAEAGGDGRLQPLFAAIMHELADPGMGTKPMVGAMMKQIMILLLRAHFGRLGSASPLGMPLMHPRLGKALLTILERPQEAHSLDTLAAEAGMSRSRFVHHFNSTYGYTPMEFVQSVRLQAAARMLRGSDLPVKAVAAAVGYASRSHFSHAFRAEFGIDPTGFRSGDGEAQSQAAVAPPVLLAG
jgi:AraC-like DNA-binding protein